MITTLQNTHILVSDLINNLIAELGRSVHTEVRGIKCAKFVSLLLPQGLGQREKWSEKMILLWFQGKKERESNKGGRRGGCSRSTLTIKNSSQLQQSKAAAQKRLGVLQNTSRRLGREWLQRLSHIPNLGMKRYRICHLSQILPQAVKNLTLMWYSVVS